MTQRVARATGLGSIAHAKTLLLYLYPFDPVYSIHSALESHAQIAHDLFASGSQLLLEFIIDRSPDLFITTTAFDSRFADLFAHSLPSRFATPGVLAHRCRTLFLRGSWSAVAITRVLRVLDSRIEVLCVHGALNMSDTGWKAVTQSPYFAKHCLQSTQTLMISANDSPEPSTKALLDGVVWSQLSVLIIYDCGGYLRLFARWLASVSATNLPVLHRIYVLGGSDAPEAADWSASGVEAKVDTVRYVEQKRDRSIPWIPSRDHCTDYVVTWTRVATSSEAKSEGTGVASPISPVSRDRQAPTATPTATASAHVDADEKLTLVYDPSDTIASVPFDDNEVHGLRAHSNVQDLLEEIEQQKSHEQQTRMLEQMHREDEADQSALDSLDRLLRNTKRQLNTQ